MTRQPVHIESSGPRSIRQAMWEIIRHLHVHEGSPAFTVNLIRGRVCGSTPRDKIRTYLNSLVKAGYLEKEIPPVGRENHYRLLKDVGVDAPRVGQEGQAVTQQKIWRTLRIVKGWNSLRAMVAQVSTETEQVSEVAVKSYLRHLAKAGYVLIKGGGVNAEYALVPARYSGAKAPMVLRTKQVYDPNLNEVVWTQEVRHD